MTTRHSTDVPSVTWTKSQRSSAQGNNCVEVARNLPGAVAIRDSKDTDGPILVVPANDWRQFTRALKHGAPVA
jgi:hypothetical protein